MRKLLQSGSFLIAGIFLFTSCEAWEDESYHEGGDSFEPALLVKEVRTTSEDSDAEGLIKYAYDTQNRVTEILTYGDLLEMDTYVQTTFQYPSATKTIMISKTYVEEALMFTLTTTIDVINSTTANVTVQNNLTGDISSVITYSAPCGTATAENTIEFMGEEFTSTTTYDYTDANCSYKEFIDGELEETVTKDDKFSPYLDPQALALGITAQHNITKVVNAVEGTTHNIVYTYNEMDYPTK